MVEVVIAELATSRDNLFNCVAFLTKICRRWPRIRLIIYTHITDPVLMNYVLRHVTHCNIVMKNDSLKQLASCVFAGDVGHSFYSSSQAKVWKYLPDDRTTLTPREFSLLEMLACGQNNNLIARNISRSNKTVSNHKQSIMKKLGCSNLAELHGILFELDMLEK
jgi:DNA-binding NarL/FixJ family response regulator